MKVFDLIWNIFIVVCLGVGYFYETTVIVYKQNDIVYKIKPRGIQSRLLFIYTSLKL